MATTELTAGNFDSVFEHGGLVLVDFWAAWCGPCQQFGPVFERVSERYPDVVFGKVDTDAEPGLATEFGISKIPTLVVIRDDVILYDQPGSLPEQALEQLISTARGLDMDAVRASPAKGAEADDARAQRPASSGLLPDDTAVKVGAAIGENVVPLGDLLVRGEGELAASR